MREQVGCTSAGVAPPQAPLATAAQKAAAAQKAGAATAQKAVANAVPKPAPVASKPDSKKSVPVGDTIKTKVNPDSSLQVTQKRSKTATDKVKKALDIS